VRYEFTHAWCEQLRRCVTIDEAYTEACAVSPPLVLTFRCPYAPCRIANNPLIAAANYRVDVHQGGRKRMRYFRSDDQHPHIRGCTCEVSTVKVLKPPAPTMSSDPIKATDVVDAFAPATNDGPPPTAGKPRVAGQPTTADKANDIGTGHTTERRLSRVASVYHRLRADDALRANQLVIAGGTYSYYSGVLTPKLLRPHEVLHRIVRGNAKLERVASGSYSGWMMSFYDRLEHFEPLGGSYSLKIELDDVRLKASARGISIAADIERLHDERTYAEVFFFGDIQEQGDAGYMVLLDSLFNLVIFPPRSPVRSNA
jgi:hypothetical protein